MKTAIEFEHLRAASAEVARQPDEARIDFIKTDHWVGYPRARQAVDRLGELLNWPQKVRMPNMLIIGPTHRGKTMILERFLREHPPAHEISAERIGVLYMLMPDIPTVREFFKTLILAAKGPDMARASTSEIRSRAYLILKECGVRLLVIDELHNVLPASGKERQIFLNVLRNIGTQLKIPIVAAGTKDAYLAIRSDPQLENRFEPFLLPRWEVDDVARSFLSSYSQILPLRKASRIDGTEMTKYLIQRSEGNVGELIELLNRAAVVAIASGEECINYEVLSATEYVSPTQRTRTAERYLD